MRPYGRASKSLPIGCRGTRLGIPKAFASKSLPIGQRAGLLGIPNTPSNQSVLGGVRGFVLDSVNGVLKNINALLYIKN